MHDWSDKSVDWKGISDAAYYIQEYCVKYGRISCHSKEKYGTVRAYTTFGHISLHRLVYPAYVYSQFPKWLWLADCNFIGPVMQKFFEKPFVKWQEKVYNRAYQGALKRWPHLRLEILHDADWLELIDGATRVEGNNTHVVDENGRILSTWRCGTDD